MRSRFIICITLLGCLFISQFAFASENPLTASVPSFAPFQFINDDEKCQGVAVVALQKITADITEPINLVSSLCKNYLQS